KDGKQIRTENGVQACDLPIGRMKNIYAELDRADDGVVEYMFVVRTAGHVLDTTVVGSIEFGVDILHTPLVVVLGHDNCGAIAGARQAMVSGELPSGMVRAIIDRVIPSIVTRAPSHAMGSSDAPIDGAGFELVVPSHAELGREHVSETVKMLGTYSHSLAEKVESGKVAIVGMEYTLSDGRAHLVEHLGDIGI